VQARFESELSLEEATTTYPAFLGPPFARDRGHLPMSADAVAELLYYGGRSAESQTKVTAQLGTIAEVAAEASYLARARRKARRRRRAVEDALTASQRRGSHSATSCTSCSPAAPSASTPRERVGQVNAISVIFDGPTCSAAPAA
jgi:predicted ATP-dependent protease